MINLTFIQKWGDYYKEKFDWNGEVNSDFEVIQPAKLAVTP